MRRNRIQYFGIGCVVVAMGLASRRYAAELPAFVSEYAGDTLWAAMVFVGIGFLAPRWSSVQVAAAALVVSFVVEGSQLYHAPWIDAIRGTRLGGLTLGFGFLWTDLVCYSVGVLLALLLEIGVRNVGRYGR